MKFARLGTPGSEIPAVMDGGKYYSLASVTDDINADFWSSGGPARAAAALAAGTLPELEAEGLRIGAPITRPSSVFCIGLNYAAHAAESGAAPPAFRGNTRAILSEFGYSTEEIRELEEKGVV